MSKWSLDGTSMWIKKSSNDFAADRQDTNIHYSYIYEYMYVNRAYI